MKCSLCGKKIEKVGTWELGHSAYPLKQARCCDECHITKVIPKRIDDTLCKK